jgi:hypothetical protein
MMSLVTGMVWSNRLVCWGTVMNWLVVSRLMVDWCMVHCLMMNRCMMGRRVVDWSML